MNPKGKRILGVGILGSLICASLVVTPLLKSGTSLINAEECAHNSKEFHEGVAPTTETEGYPDHWGCCICGMAAEDESFTKPLCVGTEKAGSIDNQARQDKLAIFPKPASSDLAKEDVKTDFLKSIDEASIKTLDQTSATYKFLDGREALYFSKAETSTSETKDGYSEFKFALSESSIKSFSFEYRYYDLNHDYFGNEDRVMAQWYDGSQHNVAPLSLINDNEWHVATIYTHDGAAHSDYQELQFDLFHFTGELYIANPKFNSVKQDIDLRDVTLSSINYGNGMAHVSSFLHTNGYVDQHNNQLLINHNDLETVYNTIGFDFEPIELSNDAKYLEVSVYLDREENINSFALFSVKENGEGKPVGEKVLSNITLKAKTWQTLTFDVSLIKESDNTLKRFGLGIFGDEFAESFLIENIRLISEKTAPTITGIEYSLETNTYDFSNVAGQDAELVKGLTSLNDLHGNPIAYTAGQDGVHNVYASVSGRSVYVEIIAVTKYIKTGEEFANAIAVNDEDNNGYYVLLNDIPGSFGTAGTIFSNLNEHYFNGSIDGRNHTVTYDPMLVSDSEFIGMIGTANFGSDSIIKNITLNAAGKYWVQGRLFGHSLHDVTFENVTFNKLYETEYSDNRYGHLIASMVSGIKFNNCTFNLFNGDEESLFQNYDKITFANCTLIKNPAAVVSCYDMSTEFEGLTLETYPAGTTETFDADVIHFVEHTFTGGWNPTSKMGEIVDFDDEGVPSGATGKVAKCPAPNYKIFIMKTDGIVLCSKFSMRIYVETIDSATESINNFCRIAVDEEDPGSNISYTLDTNQWINFSTTTIQETNVEKCNIFKGFCFLYNADKVANIYIDSFTVTY